MITLLHCHLALNSRNMRRTFILLSFLLFPIIGNAQEVLKIENWTVGLGLGYHTNAMRFPELNKELYPLRKNSHSAVFSMYAEYPFYRQFSARAEMAFLGRGGTLRMSGLPSAASGQYRLKTTYWDFRFPVTYDILKSNYKIRPYVYAAPVVSFAIAGAIDMQTKTAGGKLKDYHLDLTRANMAAAHFAVAAGAGARYPIEIAGMTFYVGLEAGYELGLTDTYSKKEKQGESISINGVNKNVAGPRKHSGFELKATASIPLSVFKKKEKKPVVVQQIISEPVITPQQIPVLEPSCYSIDEILELIQAGKNVVGKTICAIDAVNFDTGKSVIKDSFKHYLDRLATILIETGMAVEVKGHTDSVGERNFNLKLSKDRALAVVNYLIKNGVSKDSITYSYYGMSKPLTTNDTEEGRKLNRRVEFQIQ